MRIYSRRQREIEKEKEDEEKENCALSLSLFLRLCAINTPWHTRERASERAFEKNVARGKGDGAFQNFEITPNSFSFVVFFCVTCTRLSFLSQVLFGFLHAQTKKKTRTTNLPDDLQP
jgi:hypothetical protein